MGHKQTVTRHGKYRTNGQWHTVSLFADVFPDPEGRADCPYWLETNKDNDDRPVMRDFFVAYEDLTGHKVAMKLLGSQAHWDHLRNLKWFKEISDRWIVEVKASIRQKALDKITELMAGDGTLALSAAKVLLQETSTPDTKAKAGRPKKEAVQGEVKRLAKQAFEDDADFNRINKLN